MKVFHCGAAETTFCRNPVRRCQCAVPVFSLLSSHLYLAQEISGAFNLTLSWPVIGQLSPITKYVELSRFIHYDLSTSD